MRRSTRPRRADVAGDSPSPSSGLVADLAVEVGDEAREVDADGAAEGSDLDEVEASLAALALADEGLGLAEPIGEPGLGQSGVAPGPSEPLQERVVFPGVDRLVHARPARPPGGSVGAGARIVQNRLFPVDPVFLVRDHRRGPGDPGGRSSERFMGGDLRGLGGGSMTRTMRRRLVGSILLGLGISQPVMAAEPAPPARCDRVTRYDLATPGDLLLGRLAAPGVLGEVGDWPVLGGLPKQLGDWVGPYFEADALARTITEAFPIEGQPAAGAVDRLVADCSATLGVDKPLVYIRNSPLTRAYAVRAGGRHHLVLTSGLLNLFAGRPEELKFVVGRELGHVVCDHAELRSKAYALLAAAQAINVAVVPDRYQNALPLLALGRLYSWSRESEISADRGGLLCCVEPSVAYQAIMRLQHGLAADSPWIDAGSKEFDAEAVVRSFRQWQYRPFVGFLLYVRQQPLEHPYYQERLAALRQWSDTGAHRAILGRHCDAASDQLVEVTRIRAYELASEGKSVSPYAIVFDGDRRVLTTATSSAGRDAEWKGFKSTDRGVDQPRPCRDGQPLYFEVWDDGYFGDSLVGGFVVYVDGRSATADVSGDRTAEYTVPILWDWKESATVSRSGYARVQVKFSRRSSATTGVLPGNGGSKR